MPGALTKEQLSRQIQRLTREIQPLQGQAIGFRCVSGWSGGPSITVEDETYRVEEALSALQLRELLIQIERSGEKVVLLADLSPSQLAGDLLSRLHRGKLHEVEPWAVVAEAFRARRFDGRLRGKEAVALALLAHEPAEGFPPVPTGFLDLDSVWRAVMRYVFDLPADSPIPSDLLRASLDSKHAEAMQRVDKEMVTTCSAWLTERGLGSSALLLRYLSGKDPSDAIPLGLVCRVVFDERHASEVVLRQAEVRLEAIIGEAPESTCARAWGQAAESCLLDLDEDQRTRICHRADELLQQAQARDFARLSNWLPSGLDQRLRAITTCIERMLNAEELEPHALTAATKDLLSHKTRESHDPRVQRAVMASRLARWLSRDQTPPGDLLEAMEAYISELSYADWARDSLSGGDAIPEVQRVYKALCDKALTRREAFNKTFAELVRQAATGKARLDRQVLVEDFLARVVVPVAKAHRVLLVVLDGMSWAVAHELLGDMEDRRGWVPVSGLPKPLGEWACVPMLATIPSITAYSRTSLLTGRLSTGTSSDEKSGFAAHDAVKSVCSSNNPAKLFHRGDLEEPGRNGLRSEIQKSIANPQNKLIGVVINAVDDHLLKSDQVWHNWRVSQIPLLDQLLAEARSAQRMVVLAADHGHLQDRHTELAQEQDGGARWRPAKNPQTDLEVTLAGPRVTPFKDKIVVPWSEKVRYALKQNGYHGGISPQEAIAPCCVLSHVDFDTNEWREVRQPEPWWWSLEAPTLLEAVTTRTERLEEAERLTTAKELPLFAESSSTATDGPAWIGKLLETPLYAAQRKLAGARVPANMQVEAVLRVLDSAGGQVPKSVLAAHLDMPGVRIRGMVAQLRRLLNVDGYGIISLTADEGHVKLDREMLWRQFELEGEA